MRKLNLTAKGKEQELILAYLQENASETLAEKINNGVVIKKDGKRVRNKKTLDGFMQFAADEAKKLAEKGARSACIEDATVYGWAIHYFEEEEIEGALYNEDGTPYKPAPAPVNSTIPTYTPPAPKPKPQMSMFDDIFKTKETVNTPAMSEAENEEAEGITLYRLTDTDDEETDDGDEPDDEADGEPEAGEADEEEPTEEEPERQGSPFYQCYKKFSAKYPDAVLFMRLGDFYEALGEHAIKIADVLGLTLTGRDCGLKSRVPMCGIPYHASDMYLKKLSEFHDIVVVDEGETCMIKNGKTIDIETGEVTEPESMDDPYPRSTFHKETMIALYELLDGKMNLQ